MFLFRHAIRPLIGVFILGVVQVSAQIPDTFKNLQTLPGDISRDALIERMRGFSLALDVRCQYCHVGGDGVSLEGVVFESDEDPDKDKARFMIRMTEELNRQTLPLIPKRDEPPVEITCKTCHRGQSKPLLLTQSMRRVMDAEGVDKAVAHYRELRENAAIRGAFDFGEWEVNTLAERLEKEGRVNDAIAIYEMNREFYPRSLAIVSTLGRLYETASDTTAAIRLYERLLELNPESPRAKERLNALKK